MHSMLFVVIAFVAEGALEMFVAVADVVVAVYVDFDETWAMVMDRVVSVGSVAASFYDDSSI